MKEVQHISYDKPKPLSTMKYNSNILVVPGITDTQEQGSSDPEEPTSA